MKKITMVVDLQYGSTGKGLIVGYLAEKEKPDTVVTAWAPNAGHTYINAEGRKFVHTHLGNGVVSPNLRQILLGPGSLINPQQLLDEIEQCRDIIDERGIRILIHPHAAIVTERHIEEEAGPMTKIGSTKKGVGAAMIQRIRRNPDDMNVAAQCEALKGYVTTTQNYTNALAMAQDVLIEGAQGYGLSMYHGFYPYTTSRDVSTWQILADCGIPATAMSILRIVGTARTYPIRVANRFDTDGTQVGYSGPVYADQMEISFEDIGQKVELTTVTKLPRRIFTFSRTQIWEAVQYNGVDEVFLNFVNYVQREDELDEIVRSIENTGARVCWIGLGPTVNDVVSVDLFASGLRRNKILNEWRNNRVSN